MVEQKSTPKSTPDKCTPNTSTPTESTPKKSTPNKSAPTTSTQEVIHMRGCKRTSHSLLSTQWTLEATCPTITVDRKPSTNQKGILPPQQSQDNAHTSGREAVIGTRGSAEARSPSVSESYWFQIIAQTCGTTSYTYTYIKYSILYYTIPNIV